MGPKFARKSVKCAGSDPWPSPAASPCPRLRPAPSTQPPHARPPGLHQPRGQRLAALVQHARVIIGELDRTQTTIRLLSNGITGNLVVGTTPTVATGVVPRAAHLAAKRYPDAFLRLVEDRLDLLMPQLLEGRMDFVVTRTDQARLEPGLRCDLLYPEHIRIVVGPQHPLARKRKLAWADVMRYPWITPPKTSPIRRELEHELALAGQPTPRYRVESGSTLVIVSMLQDGDLVAPMSARLVTAIK